MVIHPIIFAAVVFAAYFIGRKSGINTGYTLGLRAMREHLLDNMRKYPTKWKFLIDKEQND